LYAENNKTKASKKSSHQTLVFLEKINGRADLFPNLVFLFFFIILQAIFSWIL